MKTSRSVGTSLVIAAVAAAVCGVLETREAKAWSQSSIASPIAHEWLVVAPSKAKSADRFLFPELVPRDNEIHGSNAQCGFGCDQYDTNSWKVWSVVLGQRWVDIMGFRKVTGTDVWTCLDAVAQNNEEVQYDHFLRMRCDEGKPGRARAIAGAIARFRQYFVDAALADDTPIHALDGGATQADRIVLNAYFRFGRAVHLFQDSFSSEHADRDPRDGRTVVDIKSYLCTNGSLQHSHALTPSSLFDNANGDNPWVSAIGSNTYANLKPTAKFAHDAMIDLWRAFLAAHRTRTAAAAGAAADEIIGRWFRYDPNGASGSATAEVMQHCREKVKAANQYVAERLQCLNVTGRGGYNDPFKPPFAWSGPLAFPTIVTPPADPQTTCGSARPPEVTPRQPPPTPNQAGNCNRFTRDRAGNTMEGICYAKSGLVSGTREQRDRKCEELIQCNGSTSDLGDCQLARNVCKGVADNLCNRSWFDVYNGPTISNGACRAWQASCETAPNDGERRSCYEVQLAWTEATRPQAPIAPPTTASWYSQQNCARFGRDRRGNILEGICFSQRQENATGTRDQVNQRCEQMIQCGGANDLGDCHLARNVCKGATPADRACNRSGFDFFHGPAISNGACRSRQASCETAPNGEEKQICYEVQQLWNEGRR